MRVFKVVLACLIVSAVVAVSAFAQEGHPLKGSWLGDYGPSKTARTAVFITLDWNGQAISGMINPGTDNIPLKVATMSPPPPPPARGGGGAAGGGGGGNRGAGGDGGNRGARGQGAAAPAGAAPAATPPAAAAPAGGARGGGAAGGGQQLGNQANATPIPPAPPADWLVRFEGDGKDRAGNAVKHVIEGKIMNVGLANRYIQGTWTIGTTKNDFRVVRQ